MADSFVVLPNERAGGDELDANVMARVFDIASDLSDSDHPLCAECSAALVAEVERRTEEAEAECARTRRRSNACRARRTTNTPPEESDATSEGIALAMQNVEKSQREADETLRALLASSRRRVWRGTSSRKRRRRWMRRRTRTGENSTRLRRI